MSTFGFLSVGGKKYTLKYGESYVVGCMSQEYAHDIEINDKSVDIKHCILDFTEPIPRIFDIKSKCGTFVDQERIPSCSMHPIKTSTNIQIGCVDAILQLAVEVDSEFLEEKIPPQEIGSKQGKCNATSNFDHQFAVPTSTARAVRRSADNSSTNETLDSFTIPETQAPPKDILPDIDDDEENFFIPETQDALTAAAVLNNYPRVAFENEDVNETVNDVDKIPSSQFRICTQDFNGSADELSNHSDDILANVPCSIVIPAIRHPTVHIQDIQKPENLEVEKELSALYWSKCTDQSSRNSLTPDNICTAENQKQPAVQKQSSQCSTPDIFADNDPLLDEMEKSLKENDPPLIGIGGIKSMNVIQNTSIRTASSTSNIKPIFQDFAADKSPLPPTQLFVMPTTRAKQTPIGEKEKPVSEVDDLPATQVFQPAAPKLQTGNILSSTLLDAEMQLSECSFRAKCIKLLDSDDDEMGDEVAPELVQKYQESLENAKKAKKTRPTKPPDPLESPPQENSNKPADDEKMLPPKSTPTAAVKNNPVVEVRKKNPESVVSIDDFLCTPDFLGREFSKEGNMKRVAEQNWKNQRKTLFQDKEAPTKPVRNESDDSQDSFTDLIAQKKEQEKLDEKPKNKRQRAASVLEIQTVPKPVEMRITRRRQTTLAEQPKEFSSSHSKPNDNEVKQRKRTFTKSDEKSVGVNDDSSKAKKSKESRGEGASAHKQRSERNKRKSTDSNNPEVKAEAKSSEEKDSKAKSHRKNAEISEAKPNHSREEGSSRHRQRSERGTKQTTSAGSPQVKADEQLAQEKDIKLDTKRMTRRKSIAFARNKPAKPPEADSPAEPPDDGGKHSVKEMPNSDVKKLKAAHGGHSTEEKTRADQKWAEKRNLEVVLNKNGIKKHTTNSTKSSHQSDSVGSSRTRLKTKTSEVDASKATNASAAPSPGTSKDEKESTSPLDDKSNGTTRPSKEEKESSSSLYGKSKKTKSTSRNEKESSSTRDVKSSSSSKSKSKSDKADKDAERVVTGSAVDQREKKEEVEKHLTRLTRLQSAREMKPSRSPDHSSEATASKPSRPTKGRTEPTEKKNQKLSSHEIIDMTDGDNEEQPNVPTSSSGVKRKKTEEDDDSKRIKPESSEDTKSKPMSKPKIAMTMCNPRYQTVLEKNSGLIWVYTSDPKECDVLILENANRTYKLMVAIARGIPIVSVDWLKEVLKKKSVAVPMDEYIFEDTQFQERHQFVMKKSLSLAKSIAVLKGMSFMMTPNIRPSPSEMKDIVTCAGGTVLEEMPKQKQIFLISHPNDKQYWHQYRRSNANVRIVTTEGVMASVMQQSVAPLTRSIIQ